ncbi:unnamed protein product [Dicrocoelium dendriticum]|nr:unnamed protein product [Dicrocoelium dendriticum]
MPSSQLSRGMIQVPDHTATEYTFAHPISTLHDLAAVSSREAIPNTAPTKTNLGTRGTEQLCICGNKLSCPLSLVKQRRLGTNPRVQRGFIRLAAVFRGRFVRQLLATHKVYDLIRTIKDTAKLALSIHVERKASHTLKRAESQNAEIASPQPTTDSDQLPDEELILEARLLAQLRGSLNQLHEIFFSWPLSNQIDLLRVSRSLPHRNKRATTHPEDLRHNAHVCDAACDEWPQRCATEQRRRWGSVATHGECKDSSEWTGKSNRMEMDKPPMSCGPSSLTKLIDSVRKSWPTSQLKKRITFPGSSLAALAYGNDPKHLQQPRWDDSQRELLEWFQQQHQTSLCRTRKIAAGSHRTPEFDSRGVLHSCAPVHSAISKQTASRISVPCDAKGNCPLPSSKPKIGSRISIRSTQVVTTAATGTPRLRAQSNHKQCGQRNIQSLKSVSAASSSVALHRGRSTPLAFLQKQPLGHRHQ